MLKKKIKIEKTGLLTARDSIMPEVGLGMNENDHKKYSILSSSTSLEAIISFIRITHASVAQDGRASIKGCL